MFLRRGELLSPTIHPHEPLQRNENLCAQTNLRTTDNGGVKILVHRGRWVFAETAEASL